MSYVANLYPGKRQRNAQSSVVVRQMHETERAETERAEIARLDAERLAPIQAVEAELERNLRELHKEDRERVLNLQDDSSVFEDPNQPAAFYTQQEADTYNRAEVRKFLAENPSYYPDMAGKNFQTIFEYLQKNGRHVIVSAKVLTQVFERLLSLGLLIERPAVAAPVSVVAVAPATPARPTVYDVNEYPYFQNPGGKASDLIEGYDPSGSGARVTVTRLAVEKMQIDDFKRFSRVTVQATPEWALVRDREMVARQFSELGRTR
jgi:hypothetical protein